jgi:uncharacterized membrane protein YdjX (TVP38/TMEM64 family)
MGIRRGFCCGLYALGGVAQLGAMQGDIEQGKRGRGLMVVIAGGLVLALVIGGLWAKDVDVRGLFNRGLDAVRGLGPVGFFGAMTVLPGVGCPLSVFTLTAGPVFGPVLGLPTVIALAWASLAANLALTYGLARWVLRPWIVRICGWLGYRLPEVAAVDERSLVVLVRVTPGPPYVLQSYLLGVARVKFATYFLISWSVVSAYATAFILFGDALAQGKGRGVVIAVSLFVALTVGVGFVRRKLKARAV